VTATVNAVSGRRALIWSGDPVFFGTARDHLTRLRFDVIVCSGTPVVHPRAELMVVDLDATARKWWKSIAALRTYNRSIRVLLVGSNLPAFARLRPWQPYAYLQKPFSAEHLMRVLEYLKADE
jgi:hypothetical protein